MHKNLCNNVLRTSAFALACLAFIGADVQAAAVQSYSPALHTYSTSATILSNGITGANAIGFNPVSTGSFLAPSSVGVGEFVVSTLPEDAITTYDRTRFSIIFNPVTIGDVNYPGGSAPVVLAGELNGTITGNQSTVVATFDPIESPVFTADGAYLSTLSVLDNPLNLVPASAGGKTTVQAQVTTSGPSPVPEPTTMAILLTSLVGFGLRQRLLSGRKSA